MHADSFADRSSGWTGSSATITFSGLTGSVYQVDVVSARTVNYVSDFTIDGSFADSDPNGDDFGAQADGWVNGSIMTWNSIALTCGSMTIQAELVESFILFSAVRLTEVPEPTTLALLGPGGLALLRRRLSR